MENPLRYQVIIPEEWYLNFSKHQLFDEISEHMKRLRKEEKAFDGSQLQIGDTRTIIVIYDTDRCWCFLREGDTLPNYVNYVFSGNLMNRLFPDLLEDYDVHQIRREFEKEMQDFIDLESNPNEDDEGVDTKDSREYFEDAEHLLQYEAILPKAWLRKSTTTELMPRIFYEIDRYIESGGDIEYANFRIAEQDSFLRISDEKLCWWFSLPHHDEPNTEEYIFTGNLMKNYFPELI